MASWLYFQGRTDFVISEVGLGGTLDPTNIIAAPLLTVITPISLDHCHILGDTVEKIAAEKAGILKRGVPAVIAPQQQAALMVLQQVAARRAAPLLVLEEKQLQPVQTNLQGSYQQINCNTALAALQNLLERGLVELTREQIMAGLLRIFWPGRMEYVPLGERKGMLLDGAHNRAGACMLAENLRTLYADREIILFLSILDDKEQDIILQQLVPLAHAVILTKPEHDQRATKWMKLQEKICALAPNCVCYLYEDYGEALRQTMEQLKDGQLLCITGSLYLLGDCRRLLHEVLS